jgi:predicted Rdx family selenoprotein
MATEFFAEAGNNIAITITPGEAGVLQVFAGGDKIFDKTDEGGHPELTRVKAMRAAIRAKLAVGAAAD